MLPISAMTHIGAAAIIGVSVWFFQEARYSTLIAEIQLDWQHERETNAQRLRRTEGELNAKYIEAVNQARNRERADARRLAALRAERDSLRTERDKALASFAEATAEAQLEYVTALDAVFGECTERYEAMAGAAAGHAVDAQELIEKWPVIDGPIAD